jgi:hypothetical protein
MEGIRGAKSAGDSFRESFSLRCCFGFSGSKQYHKIYKFSFDHAFHELNR